MIVAFMAIGLFSEPDNGAFLPNKEPFDAANIYMQIEPLKLQFPMLFGGLKEEKAYNGALSSVGYAASGEFGYNWCGWLFGTHLGYSYYKALNNKPLVLEFQNLQVGFNLSRVLSSKTFSKLPDWLEFTPFIGLGADLYKAKYYSSFKIKANGGPIEKVNFGEKAAFYMRTGLQMDFYFGTDYAIPFIGLEGNIVPDCNSININSIPSISSSGIS